MNDILRRALEEDAADIPDPVATLAGIHRGIRRATVRRRLTVAGAGVLVVAVAAGATTLAARRSGSTVRPADPATGGPTALRLPPGTSPLDPMRVPFRLTYLPPGWLASASGGFTDAGLSLSSRTSTQAVIVSLSLIDPAHPTAPPLSPGTRPPDNEITRDLDPTHRLTVYGHDPQVDHATLQRIANGIDLHGSTPVAFPLRLTYLPAEAGTPVGASNDILPGSTAGSVAWDMVLNLNPKPLPRPGDSGALEIQAFSDPGGAPKEKVQETTFGGHHAGVFTSDHRFEVILYDAIPHHQVLLMVPENGPVSRAELEQVAAGIHPAPNPDDPTTWFTNPLP